MVITSPSTDKLKFVGRERHHGLQIPRDNSGAVDCVDKCGLDQMKKKIAGTNVLYAAA